MKLARSFVAIMAVATLAACGDDPDEEDVDLSGVYTVSQFRYQSDANAGLAVDLASIPPSSGGPYGILDMTVEEDHSFEGTLKLLVNGVPTPFDAGGNIELTGGNGIRINFDAATQALGILDPFEVGTYSMVGSTLTIDLPNVTFNFGSFGGPNEPVESDLRIVAARTGDN